ncbi:MAG: cytoplasmic dynein with WD40 domain, partial [Paramarteilia canceri]
IPILTYSADSAIRDIKWSKFYSNLLAILLDDGKCLIFNFALDKQNPCCVQLLCDQPSSGPKLNSIDFCPNSSKILLACTNGHDLTTFKIPQTMRKCKESAAAATKKRQLNQATSCTDISNSSIQMFDKNYILNEQAKFEKIFGFSKTK